MRLSLILFVILSLFACKQSEVKSDPVPIKEASVNVTKIEPTLESDTQKTEDVELPFDIQLKDADGNVFNSKDIFKKNGKPTVLLFWLTTCMPCHMKLKAIKPLYPQWREEADFNIYAISGDFPKNYNNFVTQTKSKRWEWDTYNDMARGFRKVLPGGLNGYPQTFIFDKDGKLVYQDKKYRTGDEHRLFEKIKEICNS